MNSFTQAHNDYLDPDIHDSTGGQYKGVVVAPRTISWPRENTPWWASSITFRITEGNNWKITATSLSHPNVNVAPLTEKVYISGAKERCSGGAVDRAIKSAAFQRVRIHSAGVKLLADIKQKYGNDRRELFYSFNWRMNAEFGTGWLYREEDAQEIARNALLKRETP